jgi:hypothetical protein
MQSKASVVASSDLRSQNTVVHARLRVAHDQVAAFPRRSMLSAMVLSQFHFATPICNLAAADPLPKGASTNVSDDSQGVTGTVTAHLGDLLMFHYVGSLADGTVFDTTLGSDLQYRDGGQGVVRPTILRLGGDPQPGIVPGLVQALVGMRIGETKRVEVPADMGFGAATVLAPFAVVPAGSTLQYEIKLLRLSRRGPDALMNGVSQCGGGFVNERTSGCAKIEPAEYL